MPCAHPFHCLLSLLLASLLPVAATAGEPVRYVIDSVHTRVMFSIDHAGFSRAIGTVSGAQGELYFDTDSWQGTRLTVTVPMQRLDMGDAGWTTSVLAPRFLDTKHYPEAHLRIDHVEREDNTHGRACGALTLHGVTQPLCMTLQLNRAGRHPLPPFRHRLGFSASATLKRSDFGMRSWLSLVGDRVELRVEAELVREDASNAPSSVQGPSS